MTIDRADSGILPWHEQLWQQVMQTRLAGRMVHGLLICGPPGTGRQQFAARLARALLCHAPRDNGDACGQCPGCRQWQAGSHPDVSMLTPDGPGDVIRVDPVRAFTTQMRLTPQYDTGRLGWIEPADKLNGAAANSLLKTLEEPSDGAHLLLVTGHVDRLLSTIRSRCRIIRVPPAPVAVAREWLEGQGVATADLDADALRMPLRCFDRGEDADALEIQWQKDLAALLTGRIDHIELAESWAKEPAGPLLEWLYRTVCALFAYKLDSSQPVPEPWPGIVQNTSTPRLRQLCLGTARASYLQTTNAVWQLVLETALQQ